MATMGTLIRASGVALGTGAALSAVASAAEPFVDETTLNPVLTAVGTVGIVGAMLVLLGMPGWYAVQAPRTGRLGAVGFALVFVGWAGLEVATQPFYTYVAPALYARPGNADLAKAGALDEITTAFLSYVGVMLIALNLGLLLFGVAMVRAQVFPRVLSLIVAIGPLAAFIAPIEAAAITVLLLTLSACGLLMAAGRLPVAAAAPASPVPSV
jgi:hypothetical protein